MYSVTLKRSRWTQLFFMLKYNWKWMLKEWKRTFAVYVLLPVFLLAFLRLITNRPYTMSDDSASINEEQFTDLSSLCSSSSSSGSCVGLWHENDNSKYDSLWDAALSSFVAVPVKRYKSYDELVDAATKGDVQLGIAIKGLMKNKMDYKLVGKHSILLKYGAPLQNQLDIHFINFYRENYLKNALPPLDPSVQNIHTAKLPFVKRNLITFYSLAACAIYLFLFIAYLSDISIQVVRDRVSGFRLIMEVAGFSAVVEVFSLIISNIPVAIVMAVVVTAFEYASGNLSHVTPLESFPIFLLGFFALIPFGFFMSIRSKGNSYIVLPLFFSIFGMMGVKDDYLYGDRFVTIFQKYNYVFTPGTFSSLVGQIYESEYLQTSKKLWSTQDFRTGILILLSQFIGFTILSVALHLLLPGNITPKNLFNSKKTSTADHSFTVPTLQLRLGDNTYKGTTKGVRQIDLDFSGGQAVALLGHNGAGKSTLISLLCGVRAVNKGFFRYIIPSTTPSESKVFEMSNASTDIEQYRDYLGFCPQHNALRDDMSAYDHLEFIAAIRGVTKVMKVEDGIEREVTIKEYLNDILEKLELTYAMHRPTKTYSGGMLRKTCLAVSLVGEPSILILDEFTTGMDIVSRSQLWGMLKKVTRTNNRLVLFSTHDMEEAEVLGDMVAVVSRGQVQAYCAPPELKAQYATGTHFHIQKSTDEEHLFDKSAFEDILTDLFGENSFTSLKETGQSITYVIPLNCTDTDPVTNASPISGLISTIISQKQKFGVADFDISTESLERVFMEITERTNVPEENEIRILEKGKRTLDHYLDSLEKMHKEKTKPHHILWMRIRQTFGFSIRSSLISNGGVIFAAMAVAAIFVMFANLLSNADNRTQIVDYDFSNASPDPKSPPTRGYNLMLATDPVTSSSPNFTFAANALVGQRTPQFKTFEEVRSCILKRNRPLSGWDIRGSEPTPSTCIPGFKIVDYPMYSNVTPKVTLVVDDQSVPYANGDRFARMIQRMYSVTIYVLTFVGGNLQLPIGFTTNQPTYDQGLLIYTLNNARQAAEKADANSMFIISSGYSRIWDEFGADTINSVISVPLYVMSQSIVVAVLLQLLHTEHATGLTHHLLIHGLPPFLYKFSVALRSIIPSVFFFIIINFGLTTTMRDHPIVLRFGSILFQGSEFGQINIVNQMLAAIGLFHLVCAASANVLSTMMWKSSILRRMNVSPSSLVSIVEYLSIVSWTIFRWFTPSLSRTVTSAISVVNPFWALQEMFVNAFAIAFKGESFNLWIPSIVLGVQFVIFALLTAFDLPRDNTTINSKVDLKDIIVARGEDKVKEVGEEVLGVEGLQFSFAGGKKKGILDGVTFGINRGECFALLGRNGAGKSTTMKCLLGQLQPSSGSATALTRSLIPFRLSNIQGVLGYCPQDDKILMPGVSIIEHFVFYCAVKGISPHLHAERIRRAFDDYELPKDQLWFTVQNLSGGTKRKLSLALACLGGPDLVILDEPSAGVDVLARSNIWNIILQEKKDKAILITTHIMEESESLSDRIGFLANGKLQINEDPVQLKSNLSKTYDISITYTLMTTISEKTSAGRTVLEYIQMHIDKDAVLSETLEGSVVVTVSIGVLGDRKDVEKSEWIKKVLEKLETAKAEKDVSMIEEYALTQRSMIHLLFNHVGEMKDDETLVLEGL